jgi:hypothetical protein
VLAVVLHGTNFTLSSCSLLSWFLWSVLCVFG